MRAIARKKISRQSGDSNKASTFRLRKQPVPEQKIDRYIRSNALDEDTIFSDARKFDAHLSCPSLRLTNLQSNSVGYQLRDTRLTYDSVSERCQHATGRYKYRKTLG